MCWEAVEEKKHQKQEMKLDQSTKYWEAIEGTETFSIDPQGVEVLARLR